MSMSIDANSSSEKLAYFTGVGVLGEFCGVDGEEQDEPKAHLFHASSTEGLGSPLSPEYSDLSPNVPG